MKTGELYHIEFYFTSEYLYYDPHQSKLLLSKTKKTVFKIIEHRNKYTSTSPQDIYDNIGNPSLTQVLAISFRQYHR
jgi:predicted nucleic acid-binding OB-fold protein